MIASDRSQPQGHRRDPSGLLHVGNVPVDALASAYGTPLVVMDVATIQEALHRFRAARDGSDIAVSYAAKAFVCTELVQLLLADDFGIDICSLGELAIAERAGCPAKANAARRGQNGFGVADRRRGPRRPNRGRRSFGARAPCRFGGGCPRDRRSASSEHGRRRRHAPPRVHGGTRCKVRFHARRGGGGERHPSLHPVAAIRGPPRPRRIADFRRFGAGRKRAKVGRVCESVRGSGFSQHRLNRGRGVRRAISSRSPARRARGPGDDRRMPRCRKPHRCLPHAGDRVRARGAASSRTQERPSTRCWPSNGAASEPSRSSTAGWPTTHGRRSTTRTTTSFPFASVRGRDA